MSYWYIGEFKNDSMLSAQMREKAFRWFTNEFNTKNKGKYANQAAAIIANVNEDNICPAQRHLKRRKASTSGFFADSPMMLF